MENDVIDYVFDYLKGLYPGRVMLKPSLTEYFRYMVENQIVLVRLLTESPRGGSVAWQSSLDKIIVDITVDRFLSKLISERDYEYIYSNVFKQYMLNICTMQRYANRRGAKEKFRRYMEKYA